MYFKRKLKYIDTLILINRLIILDINTKISDITVYRQTIPSL